MITDAHEPVDGFELTVRYDEPGETFSYNRLAHKFEYALTGAGDGSNFAPPRGYQDFLKIFLDGKSVDTTLPAECVPDEIDLPYDGFHDDNRLRIWQSANSYRAYGFVFGMGKICRRPDVCSTYRRTGSAGDKTQLRQETFSGISKQSEKRAARVRRHRNKVAAEQNNRIFQQLL